MNRIKMLREELNMSQSKLGQILNKTQQQISLYENGTNELDLDGYLLLSKLFNCSIEYVAGKSDVRNPTKIDENKINVAFSSGFNGLNDTNKSIINATIAGLLSKQKEEENKNNSNNNEVKK